MRENSCVEGWLSRVASSTRRRYLDYAHGFFTWVYESGGEFAGKTPAELLDLQDKTSGRDQYRQVDMLQRWVNMQKGALNSKQNMYTAIRSFYAHNRVPLPRDVRFRIRADREPVHAELTFEDLKKIVLASNRRYRAVFLCMFQGFMGEAEFIYLNNHYEQIKDQLDKGEKRIKIWLPGRKHARNQRTFYTFIGKDAVAALTEYLQTERGPIKDGEPIFLNDQLNPITKENIRRYFHEVAVKTGIIKKPYPSCPECGAETIRKRRRPGPRGQRRWGKTYYHCTNPKCGAQIPASKDYHLPRHIRYNVKPHEMRDLARSEWDLSPAKSVCAEFFMGHDIDPNMYNKIMKLHPEWAEQEYALAEPYLNILTEDPRKVSVNRVRELEIRLKEASEEIGRLKTEVSVVRSGRDNIAEDVTALKKQMEEVLRKLDEKD